MTPKPLAASTVVTSAFLNDLVGAYDKSTSAVDVTTTLTETTLYTKSIGAGHMSTDRWLIGDVVGDFLNSSGGGLGVTFRIKFGATTLVDTNTLTIASNAARQPFAIHFEIVNLGATNSQWLDGYLKLSTNSSGTAFTTGLGNSTTANPFWPMAGSAAEDTTAAKTLTVTAQLSSTSASLSCRKKAALLRLA